MATKTLRDAGTIGIFINQSVEELREIEAMAMRGEIRLDLANRAVDVVADRLVNLRIEYAAAADRAEAKFSGPVR